VQQQDGRSGAAAAHADDGLARVDTQFLKADHRLNGNAREYLPPRIHGKEMPQTRAGRAANINLGSSAG
jgi:hypothetical protein